MIILFYFWVVKSYLGLLHETFFRETIHFIIALKLRAYNCSVIARSKLLPTFVFLIFCLQIRYLLFGNEHKLDFQLLYENWPQFCLCKSVRFRTNWPKLRIFTIIRYQQMVLNLFKQIDISISVKNSKYLHFFSTKKGLFNWKSLLNFPHFYLMF